MAFMVAALASLLWGVVQTPHFYDRSTSDVARQFNAPDAKMRMYWRIFGPAWTKAEIDRQLDLLKSSGVEGAFAYFMYPVEVDDATRGIKNQRFGSPEFLDTFAYAARAAKKRGLRFGVNGSTGWPFGGATVSLADSAKKVRQVDVKAGEAIELKEGESFVAKFQDGKRTTPDPSRAWTAYIAGPTHMRVKRPSFGAEGWVVDHYDQGALIRYLDTVVQPMVGAAGGTLTGLGCDSLESYDENWASDLPTEFRRRRGYDLIDHLPEVFQKGASDVRFDFWRTLAELTEERFTRPLGEWCAKREIDLEMEAYGTPPNPMTAAKYIQIPVGEHYEWKGFSVQKYVASAAHQAGRKVVSSEAWTWLGLPNRLNDTLSDLKLCTDLTFLSGANDLVGVDFPYSPASAPDPGWTPYYGPFMGPGNPQWRMFPQLVSYVNRCQTILRSGEPVRPVAVYIPVEDSFREGPPEQMLLDFYVRDRLVTGKATSEFGLQNALKHQSDLVHGLIKHGLDYDGIDFWQIVRNAKVQNGQLIVGPARYSALVLPHLTVIEPEAMARVIAFARQGGRVVISGAGPRPVRGEPINWRRIPNVAIVATDRDVAPALSGSIPRSIEYLELPETVGFQHIHRSDFDIIFLVNVGEASVDLKFKSSGTRFGTVYDPMLDFSDPLLLDAEHRGFQKLTLPPRSSRFLLKLDFVGSRHPYYGKRREKVVGPWTLTFNGVNTLSARHGDVLGDWTRFADAKFFSGTAVYSCDVEAREASTVRIELTDVCGAAEVRVNGVSCGYAISPPFVVNVGTAWKAGRNRIEVIVANTPVNGFIGQPKPDLTALRKVYGNRFPAPEEHEIMAGKPAPAGLIGPVIIDYASSTPGTRNR